MLHEDGRPAEHVVGIVQAERVYDQYNRDTRRYAWEEINLAAAGAPRTS